MSVHVCTFFPEFPGEGESFPQMLPFTTDTSVPQTVVPILMIHNLKDPFCTTLGCICQQNRTQKSALLARIVRTELKLQAFHDAREGGN
jgi:hypothetical protein